MRIGYYAHHHGSGHCRQADKLAALLPSALQQQLTVFTSLAPDAYTFKTIKEAQIVRLSPEDERFDEVLGGRAGQYWQPQSLHYSPVGNTDIQTRSWQLIDGMRQHKIDLMIIDVSVEVAMLCRVASMPYLYARLAGNRNDIPHLHAFAGALGLLVPYPPELETEATLQWVRQKSLYLGFLPDQTAPPVSYQDFIHTLIPLTTDARVHKKLKAFTQASDNIKKEEPGPLLITVIKGYGGHEAIDAKLPALRLVLPCSLIISLGPIDETKYDYVDIATEVSDVAPFMAHSDFLLMACGLNGIAQAYRYETPLVVLPDSRPHQEQALMAKALITQGRALSWSQFMRQVENESDPFPAQNVHQNPLLANSNNNEKSQSAAQLLMDSLASYSSTKRWFHQWLLPQLDLIPERIKHYAHHQ